MRRAIAEIVEIAAGNARHDTRRGAAEAVDITESPPATMRAKLKPRQ